MEVVMKKREIFWLSFIAVFFFIASTLNADEPGDVRGCWATYNSGNGKFQWEPFLKIAHPKNSPSEYGFPEIWGYRTWNLEPPDENGKRLPTNILESQFIPMGVNKEVQLYADDDTRKLATRCPDWLWGE